MKAIKIIIVTVVLAALGFGIYKMVTHKVDSNKDGGVTLKITPGCEKIVSIAETNINKTYRKINDVDFDGLQPCYDRLLKFYKNDPSCKNCMFDIQVRLNYTHRERFVEMSNKELAKKEWPHYKRIGALCDTCLKKPSANTNKDLNRIKRACMEYDSILAYNRKVNQSISSPKDLNSSWNMKTTKKLINGRPSVSNPAAQTTPGEESERPKVQAKLFAAHVEYLKKFVLLAKDKTTKQPSSNNWERWSNKVFGELITFENNAQETYGKSPSGTVTEVKNGLFDAHVAYLKAFADTVKTEVTKRPEIVNWNNCSKGVTEELTKFKDNAQNIYGKSPDDKVKEVKWKLFDAHAAYLDARIQQARKSMEANPTRKQYNDISDSLNAEIESFRDNANNLYGKTDYKIVDRLFKDVRDLQALIIESATEGK